MSLGYDPETDKLEQMMDSISPDFEPTELAECMHKAFCTEALRSALEPTKMAGLYYAIMFRLHARIIGRHCPKTFLEWTQANSYRFR